MGFSFGAPAPAPAAGGGFSFGGTPAPAAGAAAAPSTSLFGAPAAPTPASGGLFGAPAAPAPAGGGLFGAPKTPAPAGGGLFGAPAPAPTAGGGLFGATTAPAPAAGGGLFGATAPAPATTGLFGATPAPATSGLFGATTAPAPASGGLFGATAPAAASQQMMQQQQQQQQPFSGNTPYAQLPDNAKRAIDQIYQLMMQHRRTLASVKTMAPALLNVEDGTAATNSAARGASRETPSPADAAAGSPRRPASSNSTPTDLSNQTLPQQMTSLQTQIQTLLQSAETNLIEAQTLKLRAGEAAVQAKMHGAWPVENVAARRGVALSSIKGLVGDLSNKNNAGSTATPSLGGAAPAGSNVTNAGGGAPASSLNLSGMTNIDAEALQQIMNVRASHVDRIEKMPSPYFWEVLRDFEQRVDAIHRDVEAVRARLAIAEEAERVRSMGEGGRVNETSILLGGGGMNTDAVLYAEGTAPLPQKLATLARSQNDMFLRIAAQAARSHEALEEMKLRYQRFCQTYTRGGYYEDPFLKADVEEVGREREMQQRIRQEQVAMAEPPKPPAAAPQGAAAPAGGLFGQPAAAPAGGGLFGATAPAPGGGLFGASTPAPGGGLFGTPAPAPSTGGLFGQPAPAPAPVGGGLFCAPAPAPAGGGLFGAPAPAAGGGLFGAAAPAPATGGGLFGAAATPAPAGGGGLFGATAPAPSLFGAAPTTPASTLAPRKKSGSRSGGRRR